MALITRLTRLFQADMNAVLDKIEDPSLLLKQSIREMEECISNDEQQLRIWETEHQQLNHRQQQLAESLSELESKVALCFESQKDDLARSLIKRKLETQQAGLLLGEKIKSLKEKITALTQRIAEQQSQFASMKQKTEVLLDTNRSYPCSLDDSLITVREEDVEVAFLVAKQKWSES